MVYTLFDATRELAQIIGGAYDGQATAAGSLTSLTDTNNPYEDGYFNGGTMFIPARTGDIPAQSRTITTFISHVFTIASLSSGSVASGCVYTAAAAEFRKHELIQAVNQAIREHGKIEVVKAFAATAGQEVYDVDDEAVIANQIVKVEITTDDDTPYVYQDDKCWRQTALGDSATLEFYGDTSSLENATSIRLTYLDEHAELSDDDDEISPQIPREEVVWGAAVKALRTRYSEVKGDDESVAQLLNEAQQRYAASKTTASRVIIHPAGW